jgi:hypothetical protein
MGWSFTTHKDYCWGMKKNNLPRQLAIKRAIAFAYAHGEEVNWEKVSSSLGRPCLELKAFFEKAKKYAPGIISMISPSAASATGTTLISLTLAISGLVPPLDAGTASATPTSATDREAEVA